MVETSGGGFALVGSTKAFDGDDAFWLIRTDEYGIPEFPSWLILPLFLIASLFALIIKKGLLSSGS